MSGSDPNRKYFYNVHTHLFSHEDVPKRWAGVLTKLLHEKKNFTLKLVRAFFWIFDKTGRFEILDRLAAYANIGFISDIKARFEKLSKHYMDKHPVKFICITMNQEFMDAGEPPRPYQKQIEELLSLKKHYESSQDIEIIPFIHVDPREFGDLDNYDEDKIIEKMKEYFIEGVDVNGEKITFKGLKIYPPLGVFPWDVRLIPMYRFCQENRIPVIGHTSMGPVFSRANRSRILKLMRNSRDAFKQKYSNDPIFSTYNMVITRLELEYPEINKDTEVEIETNEILNALRNWNVCSAFAHPVNWKIVLEMFDSLHLNLAHFGGNKQIEKYFDGSTPPSTITHIKTNWYEKLIKILKDYNPEEKKRVFVDIWGKWKKKKIKRYIPQGIQQANFFGFQSQILFGTDFYMNNISIKENQYVKEIMNIFNQYPNIVDNMTSGNIVDFLNPPPPRSS